MSLNVTVHNLKMQYNAHPVLDGLEFDLQRGELLALLGANGAGKSTLLRCISRVLEPTGGSVCLDGRDISNLTALEIARQMAVVPQEGGVDFEFTVQDIVLMGRFPHIRRFQKEGEREQDIALSAMEMTGVAHLAQRPVTTLSGGEKQRVIIARAICQQPKLLLLDEPTASLDIGYQYELLELAVRLNREKGITIIAAIHDLNLASQFFDRFILLSEGKVLAAGRAEEVITAENIKKSYGVPAVIFRHPLHGHLQVSIPKQQHGTGINKKGPAVHVIGGGSEALPVLDALRERGCKLSVGPVTAQDSGYQYASFYRIPLVEVPPFSPVSDEIYEAHLRMIREAVLVVVPPIPFGEGNLRNLQAVEQASREGIPVFILEEETSRERDYTGGQATAVISRLKKKGAFVTTDTDTMIAYLYGQDKYSPKEAETGGGNKG
ncbi:MAG: ABC transporter ATP-binding protein [Bacillota bacterium]|nr:ABC transporter ATP-binding protein [Bacillota bacterium]